MKTLVERSAQYLSSVDLDEKNPYMTHNRVLKKYLKKKHPRQRFPKRQSSSTHSLQRLSRTKLNNDILGRDEDEIRHKARRHKQARERWPNRVLRWNSTKDDYVPEELLNNEELKFNDSFLLQELLDQMLDMNQLDEVSWRNISVVGFGASLLMWGKKLDQRYSSQKRVASKLKQSDDPFHKSVGEFIEIDAEMMKDLRHMIVRVGGLAASGALNIDRAYKYLVKKEKKRR